MHRMFIPTDVPYSREKKLGQGKVEDIRGVWRRTGGVACKGFRREEHRERLSPVRHTGGWRGILGRFRLCYMVNLC